MEVAKRINLSRMIEKIEKNKNYADKIGTINRSKFKAKKKEELVRGKEVREYKC